MLFNSSSLFYGRTVAVCPAFRATTLLVTVALCWHHSLYIYFPKGFFPVQDTGVILGVSKLRKTSPSAAMARRQHALAGVILKDPAVQSLSSFIRYRRTNSTLNTAHPNQSEALAQRKISATDVIAASSLPLLRSMASRSFFSRSEPTVEDRVSRTQFQYSLKMWIQGTRLLDLTLH